MPWNHKAAQARIRQKMKDVPQVEIQGYSDGYYPTFLERQKTLRAEKLVAPEKPLFDLPANSAILVNSVQIYVNIINYEEYRLEDGVETEESHKRALQFLHLHYSACDRVIENTKAQRVDFHSARLHAVVLEDATFGLTRASVIEALHLAKQLQVLSEQANQILAENGLGARFRIGIDAGQCVAINSGNGKDKEPLFLGSAANHAAKLADGDVPGIFLSDRARTIMNMPQVFGLENERQSVLTDYDYQNFLSEQTFMDSSGEVFTATARAENLLSTWRNEISEKGLLGQNIPDFTFHYKQPPLADIKYEDIYPSNSIRMSSSSIFADLDGYTAYIDNAMLTNDVSAAVRAIHVIRSELQSVLEEDFGGRKIRFIGDCIHGLIAEGTDTTVSLSQTMRSTALCAGALRSSFELCQSEIPNINELGLAIGTELGQTPISRIGIRGERGVRVASSASTIESEELQRECNGKQTKFGDSALANLPTDLENLVDNEGMAFNLNYDDVAVNNVGIELGNTESQPSAHRSHCDKSC